MEGDEDFQKIILPLKVDNHKPTMDMMQIIRDPKDEKTKSFGWTLLKYHCSTCRGDEEASLERAPSFISKSQLLLDWFPLL